VPLAEPYRLPLSGDRCFALTFDDGFRSVFDLAMEPLAACGCRATLFVVADLIGRYNEWQVAAGDRQESLMDEYQLRECLPLDTNSAPTPVHTMVDSACSHCSQGGDHLKQEEDRRPIQRSGHALLLSFGDWSPAVRDMVLEAGLCHCLYHRLRREHNKYSPCRAQTHHCPLPVA